jgi:hypothetical protein
MDILKIMSYQKMISAFISVASLPVVNRRRLRKGLEGKCFWYWQCNYSVSRSELTQDAGHVTMRAPGRGME